MSYKNEMNLKFLSLSENESFSRLAVASFCSNLNLTIEDLTDIKTAVSEAVTNCVVHAYENKVGYIELKCFIDDKKIHIEVIDNGIGIDDVENAMQPFFTSKPESERSGMGFTVMEGFMDEMQVISAKDKGTRVVLIKNIK